jgi:hypothetical protein
MREVCGWHVGEPREFVDVDDIAGGGECVAELSLDVGELLSERGPTLCELADLLRSS